MKRTQGEAASRIILPAIDGSHFDTDTLIGKPYMLSFFRFATCPFCNMRVQNISDMCGIIVGVIFRL